MTVTLIVLGALFGSFLNVVSLRHNSGLSIMGRSSCPHCGRKLKPHEMIPILSFFLLGRRCRNCKARISWQYPLVELWTALVFATVFNPTLSFLANVLVLAVFSLYIAITVYDYWHKIIPDKFVYIAIVLALVFRVMVGGEIIDYLAGPFLAVFFAAIWLISQGRAMGFGDAKLALSIGLLLGAQQGFSAIVLAFWLGAIVGIAMIISSKINPLLAGGKKITISSGFHLSLKSEIPFAPFIILGAWLALLFNLDLLHVAQLY